MEVSGYLHATNALTLGERALIQGWMGPRASLDVLEGRNISCPDQKLNPDCTAYSLVTIMITLTWLLFEK
jgi:hypothetical protein